MNKFLKGLNQETNFAYTENAALARQTTNSAVLDFFAQGGALRHRDEEEVRRLFDKAYCEDKLLSLKALFYFRDVRGGQGERNSSRILWKFLADLDSKTMKKNLIHVPFYGRWDDMYAFVNTKLEKDAFQIMKLQFADDLNEEHPSLLGKWLKSENTSSKQSVALAKKTRKYLNFSSKDYRYFLSTLRKRINIVERLMCSNQWEDIEYNKVPSNAGFKYSKAFGKHDGARYQAYIQAVKEGKEKINVNVLYPYEIIRSIFDHAGQMSEDVLDAMWNNLPDYTGGSDENSLCVVDTSGSMAGLPICVSVSLGIYCGERAKGPYKDHFITFSMHPKLQKIQGSTIVKKAQNLYRADWDGNTDIEAVFDLILKVALQNKLRQKEMVDKLYIISDMEFDEAVTSRNWKKQTLFEGIGDKYQSHGYKLPKLVFWNVDARNEQFPMSMDERGFQLVSGCSPSIFKNLMQDKFLTAYDLMLDVLNSERYERITL